MLSPCSNRAPNWYLPRCSQRNNPTDFYGYLYFFHVHETCSQMSSPCSNRATNWYLPRCSQRNNPTDCYGYLYLTLCAKYAPKRYTPRGGEDTVCDPNPHCATSITNVHAKTTISFSTQCKPQPRRRRTMYPHPEHLVDRTSVPAKTDTSFRWVPCSPFFPVACMLYSTPTHSTNWDSVRGAFITPCSCLSPAGVGISDPTGSPTSPPTGPPVQTPTSPPTGSPSSPPTGTPPHTPPGSPPSHPTTSIIIRTATPQYHAHMALPPIPEPNMTPNYCHSICLTAIYYSLTWILCTLIQRSKRRYRNPSPPLPPNLPPCMSLLSQIAADRKRLQWLYQTTT